MQDSQKLIEINAIASHLGYGRMEYAVVSPCQGCRGFLRSPEQGGSCPRRHWLDRAAQGEPVHPALLERGSARLREQLYRSRPDPEMLENPVYSPDLSVALVWIAALSDNGEVRDPETGRLLAPDLGLVAGSGGEASYPTEHLRCRLYPYLPGQSGRSFSDLLFRPWEPVLAETMRVASRAPGEELPPLAGHVRRLSLAFRSVIQPPARSLNPSGF